MAEYNFFNSPIFQEALKEVGYRMDAASQRNVEIFGKTWYGKHFSMAEFAKTKDEFSALLGQMHLDIAASTINRNAAPPVRPLDGFGLVKAEMLTFAHTYPMQDEDIRAIVEYSRYYNRSSERRQVIDYITKKLWNVRQKAINGVNERLDIMILGLLSNEGKFTFTKENDPNSPFIGKTINFGFDESHAASVTTDWTDANKATVDIIADIAAVIENADHKPTKMLMRRSTLNFILSTAILKRYINGTDNASRLIVEAQVNAELERLGLPTIEVVDKLSRTIDGTAENKFNPFTDGKILFVPEDNFGTIEHLITNHDLGIDDDGVTYGKYNHIEVASWMQGLKEGTSHTEFVSASLTGTPIWENALDCYSLDVLPSTR